MSSIYRKGRDGYYYYQAYVYNPATRKKNKKIFHSLGTKDLALAKAKKIELDKKYQDNNEKKINGGLFERKKNVVLIFFTIAILFFLIKTNFKKPVLNHTKIEETPNTENLKLLNKIDSTKIQFVPNSSISKNEKIKKIKKINKFIDKNTYRILREVPLGSNFSQIKIYAVLDIDDLNNGLEEICRHIRKDYMKYSNVIICLYNNDQIGNALAKGEKINLNSIEKRDSWLALFTYNEVEGEYFDDNPTGYLGIK